MRVNRILRRYGSEIKLVGIFTVIGLLFAIYNLVNTSLAVQNKGTTLSSSTYIDKIEQLPTYTPYPTLVVPTTVQINIFINNTTPIYNEFTTNAILQSLSQYPTQTVQPILNNDSTVTPIATSVPINTYTPTLAYTPTPLPIVSSFTGRYFNNNNLSGSPILTRVDSRINFDWGIKSPDSKINSDQFSISWESIILAQTATYEITTKHDDGMRIFINGLLVHDHWTNLTYNQEKLNINLEAGNYVLRIEYFDNLYNATAQFDIKKL